MQPRYRQGSDKVSRCVKFCLGTSAPGCTDVSLWLAALAKELELRLAARSLDRAQDVRSTSGASDARNRRAPGLRRATSGGGSRYPPSGSACRRPATELDVQACHRSFFDELVPPSSTTRAGPSALYNQQGGTIGPGGSSHGSVYAIAALPPIRRPDGPAFRSAPSQS